MTIKLTINIAIETQKNVVRRLGKIAMSHTLQVFEVMNKKTTYFNINFKFISGP